MMDKAEYLEMLKAHDWYWGFGSTNTQATGRRVEKIINGLAANDGALAELLEAYQEYRKGNRQEPSAINEQPQQDKEPSKQAHNLKSILLDAWEIARNAVRRLGGKTKDFIACAMRQAWAKTKAKKLNSGGRKAMPNAVYYICFDDNTGRNTRRISQSLIDEVFTDQQEAKAALNLLQQAFTKPFIKTSRYYRP